MQQITQLRIQVTILVILALVLGGVWLVIPTPPGVDRDAFYSPLGAPAALVDLTLAIGGGVFFIRALRNFKNVLRPAWGLVATAQIILGLLTLSFPYVEYYYLWSNPFWNIMTYMPYFIGGIFMYFGIRKFYRLLDLKSRILSPPIIGLIILIAWGLHAFIPHAALGLDVTESTYDMFELIPMVPIILYISSTYMVFRMRLKAGAEYKRPFTWLAIGLGLQAFSTITIGVLEVIGYENWYFSSRAYEIPIIIGDVGILTAAYYFNAIGLQTGTSKLWRFLSGKRRHPATSLDIITYVSGMSSDATQIDGYLDSMRLITSTHQQGTPLSPEEERKLADVYLQIEQFLITKESLRTFDVADLRGHIVDYFDLHGEGQNRTFWSYIETPKTSVA